MRKVILLSLSVCLLGVMNASAFKRGDYYGVSYPREQRVIRRAKNCCSSTKSKKHFCLQYCPVVDYVLKFLLGLLNSKLLYYWLYNKGKRKGEMLELYIRPLSEIPIKSVSPVKQRPIIGLVERILAAKQRNAEADVRTLEREIDQLVYVLYGLTAEEIKIVENETEVESL